MSILHSKVQEAHRVLSAGEAGKALALLQPLAARYPREADVMVLLTLTLHQLGRFEQGLFYARRAAELRPGDASIRCNLGLMLSACKKPEEAKREYERCIEMAPHHADGRLALANLAIDERRASEAVMHCREALKGGWHAQVCVTMAGALSASGHVEDSIAMSREALEHVPQSADLWSGLCSGLNYAPSEGPGVIAEAHRRFGEALMARKPERTLKVVGSGTRGKRLGFVSHDFRAHSVAYFIEPFFRHAAAQGFEVWGYSTTGNPDAVTERLKGMMKGWRECAMMNAQEMAHRIAADGIDILVDLGGHTLGNSLPVFALRPAPVQVTYCGYPNTTGLTTIDWRIVDSRTDPVGGVAEGEPNFDARCTERLLRLDPCFLCYRAPEGALPPRRREGKVVFASFNANKKLTPAIIAVWAKVLERVKGSRLLLKTFELGDEQVRARVRGLFEAGGIGAEQVEMLGPTKGLEEHLAMYHRAHIALDTSPYNGTTTTCEASWMGVPVVTMAGRTHASRVGMSLLTCMGVPELIAADEAEYVEIAAGLAGDAARMQEYHLGLREKMATSALCDEAGFAARLGEGFMGMWEGRP